MCLHWRLLLAPCSSFPGGPRCGCGSSGVGDPSIVLPCQWVRFYAHLLCPCSRLQVVSCTWPYILLDGLRPLPEDSLCTLWLPACLLWSSLHPRVCGSSSLSPWFFPLHGSVTYLAFLTRLGPSRSRSLIPSLAPSWWSPCPLLRWALLTLYGCVLSVPSAFFFASVSFAI